MTDTTKFKGLLAEEKARLEMELRNVAHKNPDVEGDWDPSAPDLNNPSADPNDVADSLTAFETNAAIEVELEARLLEVETALNRIEIGSYGVCRICKAPIEEKRLEANPAASTCIEHREE